jgi:hypothetical protein
MHREEIKMTAREDFLTSLSILEEAQSAMLVDLNATFEATAFTDLQAELQANLLLTVPGSEVETVIRDTLNCLNNCAEYVARKATPPLNPEI